MVSNHREWICRMAFGLLLLVSTADADVLKGSVDDFWFSHSIIANQEGKACEVIDVIGSSPKILNEHGKKSPISESSKSAIIRSAEFHDGYVLINGLKVESLSFGTVTDGGVKLHRLGDGYRGESVELEFVADRDMDDCYLALIVSRGISPKLNSNYNLVFKSLGKLKAGKKKKASILLGQFVLMVEIIPMVFSHGKEIHTNKSPQVAAFTRRLKLCNELGRLALFVQVNQGRDRPAECIYRTYPHVKISKDGPMNNLPEKIPVTFSVNVAGNVESVQILATLPPAITQALNAAFREWMFLPAIKNGEAIPAALIMTVPLRSELGR